MAHHLHALALVVHRILAVVCRVSTKHRRLLHARPACVNYHGLRKQREDYPI